MNELIFVLIIMAITTAGILGNIFWLYLETKELKRLTENMSMMWIEQNNTNRAWRNKE